MKIIGEFGVLFAVSLGGVVIAALVPFPFPASVAGMLLLFLLLFCRVIKLRQVETVGDFLTRNMGIFFVPSCVDILSTLSLLQSVVWQMIIICVVSTVLAFLAAVYTVRLVTWLQPKGREGKQHDASA